MEDSAFFNSNYSKILGSIDSAITKPQYAFIKRILDITLATVLFLLFLPLMLLLCLVILFEHHSWPIYRQKRALALEGKQFFVFKLRTIKDAGKAAAMTSHSVFIKPDLVSFVSGFDSWLRKAGLDEIPQLINVIRGDMSIIGPRPLSIPDLEILRAEFPELYERRRLLRVKPGVSGPWQLFGIREYGMNNLVELDEHYVLKQCLRYDIFLIIRTIPVLLSASHSDSILRGGK